MSDRSHDGFCYFLVCYRSVEYVSYLLASLHRSIDSFIIHCDSKAPAALKEYLRRLQETNSNIIVMPSHDYSWAGYSHVELSLRAIEIGSSQNVSWDHFIFLSEEHLPLASPEVTAKKLSARHSMVSIRSAAGMTGDERDDLLSRYGAVYRELPGVGCFAISPRSRDDSVLGCIYHGSNWMVLHRSHCSALMEQERLGAFKPFQSVVHAEENAILSVLQPWHGEITNIDPTLVAFPHLTDNHSLIMSEGLFRSALDGAHLFIRKRTSTLSPFVKTTVEANHFSGEIYALAKGFTALGREKSPLGEEVWRRILEKLSNQRLEAHRIEPAGGPTIPLIHIMIGSKSMKTGLSVRIISENLRDYRVFLTQEKAFTAFRPPVVKGDMLFSNIRAKLFGLFGYRDILPLSIENAGFISLADPLMIDPIVSAAACFVEAGAALAHESLE